MLASQLIPDLSGLLRHFLPETLLCAAVPLILLADLLAGRGRREGVASALALGSLVLAFFVALGQPWSEGAITTKLLRADGLAKAFRVLVLGTGMIAAVAAIRGDVRRSRTEFFVVLLGAVLGACFTAASNDLAMLFVSIELLSIAGYLLAGFRKSDVQGSEAALKYVIFGAISSGLMLYGMTLLYGFAGTATISTPDGQSFRSLQSVAGAASASPAFLVAIVMVFAGLAYKIAAAPFQFWCPDVYQGAPTSVAAFLAVAAKGAGFAAVLRVVGAVTGGGQGLTDALAANNETVRTVLLLMALVTMTVGNVAALRQHNSKRLLAYSAIAHAGYLLLGVCVTTHSGAAAVVFYMVVYLFMTLGAFTIVGIVERATGRTDIDAFEGLGFRAPLLGVCMATCLIGLTGLPPTGGFVGKLFLFREVFNYSGAHGSMLFFWGGVIGLLNGVVSLYYYARFLKVMYLFDAERVPPVTVAFAGVDRGLTLAVTVPVLVLGLAFGGLWGLAEGLTRGVF